jgi:hypothetical protein
VSVYNSHTSASRDVNYPPPHPLIISLGWTAAYWLRCGLFANIPQSKQTAGQLYEFSFNIILSCLLFSKPADCNFADRCLFLFSVSVFSRLLFVCKMQIRAKTAARFPLDGFRCHDGTSVQHGHCFNIRKQSGLWKKNSILELCSVRLCCGSYRKVFIG